jgi:hypothetical protein
VFFTATALVSDNKDFQIYVKNKYGDNGLQTLSFINNAGKYFAGAYMGRGAVNYISSSLEKKAIQETLKLMQEDAELSARYKQVFDAVDAEAVRLDKEGEALAKAGQAGDTWQTIKNSISGRIAGKQGWVLKYTDAEIQQVLANGKSLNLSEKEIEDIILNGCRPDKTFSAVDLISQTNFWNVVKQRGYPNLFNSLQEYEQFSNVVKDLAKEWDLPANSIYVQGSSLRMKNVADIGDLDIAIKVDAATFDKLVERFKNATTAKQAAINADKSKGLIRGVNMHTSGTDRTFTGLFYDNFKESFGLEYSQKFQNKGFQLSVIKEGSSIDISPYLKQ